jgi:hypothetical protein
MGMVLVRRFTDSVLPLMANEGWHGGVFLRAERSEHGKKSPP